VGDSGRSKQRPYGICWRYWIDLKPYNAVRVIRHHLKFIQANRWKAFQQFVPTGQNCFSCGIQYHLAVSDIA